MAHQSNVINELNYIKNNLKFVKLNQDDLQKVSEMCEELSKFIKQCSTVEQQLDPRNAHNSCTVEHGWFVKSLFPAGTEYVTLADIKYYYTSERRSMNLSTQRLVRALRKHGIIGESTTIRNNNHTVRASKVLKHIGTDLF